MRHTYLMGCLLVYSCISAMSIDDAKNKVKKVEASLYVLRHYMAQQYHISPHLSSQSQKEFNEVQNTIDRHALDKDFDINKVWTNCYSKLTKISTAESRAITEDIYKKHSDSTPDMDSICQQLPGNDIEKLLNQYPAYENVIGTRTCQPRRRCCCPTQ